MEQSIIRNNDIQRSYLRLKFNPFFGSIYLPGSPESGFFCPKLPQMFQFALLITQIYLFVTDCFSMQMQKRLNLVINNCRVYQNYLFLCPIKLNQPTKPNKQFKTLKQWQKQEQDTEQKIGLTKLKNMLRSKVLLKA